MQSNYCLVLINRLIFFNKQSSTIVLTVPESSSNMFVLVSSRLMNFSDHFTLRSDHTTASVSASADNKILGESHLRFQKALLSD